MRITDDLLKEVFDNPPVKEVAFELRFNPLLKIGRDLAQFQEQITVDYPSYSNEKLQVDRDLVDAWRFTSEDGTKTIRVADKLFGFITNKYETFERYKTELFNRAGTFTKIFGIERIRRVGLRYINNILIQKVEGQYDLLRYVGPVIDASRINPQEITRLACELRLKKARGTLTMRTGLIDVPEEIVSGTPRAVYILDLDFYDEGTLPLPTPDLLDEFHRHIQVEFLTHLKEEYLPIMRVGRP